jgi:hypothetical protein
MTTMMESSSSSPPHAVVVEPPCDFPPHRLRRRLPQFVEIPNLHMFVVGVAMIAIIVGSRFRRILPSARRGAG